ncbi:hypothetical protein PRIPAC_77645 [Pristionchus pacificus]|uniref:Uncharacterized protein n=1 Tax=Pristionchus pacificus TaxID=54126 RepID=A0A8R1ZC36_PRIPA|nr:hypothetical protein PRIPAC_77645 [Pristionchus pacificus]
MFRMGGPEAAPPAPRSKYALINTIYHEPFNWAVTKGALGFIFGVIVARSVSEEWAASP